MKIMTRTNILLLWMVAAILSMVSCNEVPIPKPREYFRIDIPDHSFKNLETVLPMQFEYADYALAETKIQDDKHWLNIHYKQFKATIHISYFPVSNNINSFLEKEHQLAYKHISKANNIDEQVIIKPEKKIYGLIYNILGSETATPINFYMTDSTRHFVRGALYFNVRPNNDSLAPVIQSIESDIAHMIETFEWKEQE